MVRWHCVTDGRASLLRVLGAAGLASVHVFSQRLRVLGGIPRNRLISAMGGMAVVFVILRLLPAIGAHQETVEAATTSGVLGASENHVYILFMISIVVYFGLERLARVSRKQRRNARQSDRASYGVFWLHTITFALMNFLIGYLLIGRAESGLLHLGLFASAMLSKFIVNDHGLHRTHKELYENIGR